MSDDLFEQVLALLTVQREFEDFVRDIKTKNRYFASDIFLEYAKILLNLKEDLKKETKYNFFRARILNRDNYGKMQLHPIDKKNNDSGIHGFAPNEMSAPPAEKASPGRVNPQGISYLYLATTPQTACAELHPTLFDFISVAEFKLTQNIKVINLKRVPPSEREHENVFFYKVIKAFSMPIRSSNAVVDYAPSQYLAAYLQKNGIDGIEYGSMNAMDDPPPIKECSFNLALFNPDMAQCVSSKSTVYYFAQRQTVFQNISVLDEQTVEAKSKPLLLNEKNIESIHTKLNLRKSESVKETERDKTEKN